MTFVYVILVGNEAVLFFWEVFLLYFSDCMVAFAKHKSFHALAFSGSARNK